MKIKLDQFFLDAKGKEMNALKECCIMQGQELLKNEKGEHVTTVIETPNERMSLRDICATALLANHTSDNGLSGMDKNKRFILWKNIIDAKESIDIETEDVTMLKKLIGQQQPTLVVGQAYQMIEG